MHIHMYNDATSPIFANLNIEILSRFAIESLVASSSQRGVGKERGLTNALVSVVYQRTVNDEEPIRFVDLQ